MTWTYFPAIDAWVNGETAISASAIKSGPRKTIEAELLTFTKEPLPEEVWPTVTEKEN